MFKCEICGKDDFEKITSLTTHIQFHHKEYTTQTYYDEFFKKEGEGVCKTCGKPTKFRTLFAGYSRFCSNKCVWQDPEVKAKRADSISKLSEEQKKDWRNKQIESCRNSEGYCISEEEVKKRAEISKKSFEEYFSKCDCTFVSYVVHPKRLVTFRCNKCGNEATYVRSLVDRMARNEDYGLCHYCNNRKSVSIAERELRKFLNELAPEEIKLNNRRLIDKMELDIVLPEHKLAIEYDGLYWHNENVVENNYHFKKTEACESVGYQLIHIFEDEWRYKRKIVESRLNGLLGKNEKIYARKTVCKPISYQESKEFLEKSHIQGNCMSKWQYGLFYNDNLVAVMTFGKSRFAKEWELLRFANALDTNVVGGASKLLSHFVKDHPEIDRIISYADRRWSRGNLYEKIGFKFLHKTEPSYFYHVGRQRKSRFEFQKHKLVAEGADPNKTEHEIMKERKCPRIYDCGTLKYEWTRS